ncbi:MAG: FG-GAP repeat protein [Polyangiaceae bacterium]|jgi:hypothetical protein|nr:FG-GAP repeat protein [Polyangiaceae bacterium]
MIVDRAEPLSTSRFLLFALFALHAAGGGGCAPSRPEAAAAGAAAPPGQAAPPVAPAGRPAAAPAFTKLVLAKRATNEVVGAMSQPRISPKWLTVTSGVPGGGGIPDAVKVFRKTSGGWAPSQDLLSDHPGDDFGFVTAIHGDTIAVGAPTRDVNGAGESGAVLIFDYDGSKWAHTATLTSPAPAAKSHFGSHVALDRGTVVVSEEPNSFGAGQLAPSRGVYVFAKEGGRWTPQATLHTPEELTRAAYPAGGHGFGSYTKLDRDTLAVSAHMDRVFLYEREPGGRWQLRQRLDAVTDPNDSKDGPGFARSLDLEGDTLVVSSLRAAGLVPDAGAVIVYRRAGSLWRQEAKLVAPDGATRDMFGHWVAIDGGIIFAAAFRASVEGHQEVGATYAFRRVNGQWSMTAKLVPPDPAQQKFTGYELDVAAGTAVLTGGPASNPESSDYVWLVNLAPLRP